MKKVTKSDYFCGVEMKELMGFLEYRSDRFVGKVVKKLREGKLFLIDAFNDVPLVSLHEMPRQYYDVILNDFVGLIEQKFNSNEINTLSGVRGSYFSL